MDEHGAKGRSTALIILGDQSSLARMCLVPDVRSVGDCRYVQSSGV